MPRLPSFLALLFPLAACDVLAQDTAARTDTTPTPTPFRPGQWAVQFGGGFSFATFGVLRFTSTSGAWLLDARLAGGHSHSDVTYGTPTGDTTISSFDSDASISARIGRRFYRARGARVASFLGTGVQGGFAHSAGGQGRTGGESDGWSAGAYGELGGAYLLTDRFTIGATADLSFVYTRRTTKSTSGPPSKSVQWSYDASTPNLRFAATVYF